MSDGKKTNKKTSTTLKEIFTNKTVLAALAITVFLLIVFHMLSILTTPGIHISGSDWQNPDSSFESMMNLLAGGGLQHMSLLAVGVGPYITAQIIVQLLSSDLIPPMAKMAKAGERGRKKLEIITRFLTLPFCVAQGYAVLALLLRNDTSGSITVFGQTTLGALNGGQIISLLLIFIAGTYISIFIGDMITKRGVGNGVTLLILAGIVSSIISNFEYAYRSIASKFNPGQDTYTISIILSFGLYVLFFVAILLSIIFINGSTRKIPIQQTGQGLTTDIQNLPYLPIKLNSAGVIPVIFASSIITIPGTIAQFLPEDNAKWFIIGTPADQGGYLTLDSWSGLGLYFLFIILFSFFYSYVQINPSQLSENFEKSGKFIPGIKNGTDTEKHITKVLSRINWIGAPFLAIIAITPYIVSKITGIPSGLALGGTGLIIIVTGTLELWNSIISASTTSGYNVTRTRIESKFYEAEDLNNDQVAQMW